MTMTWPKPITSIHRKHKHIIPRSSRAVRCDLWTNSRGEEGVMLEVYWRECRRHFSARNCSDANTDATLEPQTTLSPLLY